MPLVEEARLREAGRRAPYVAVEARKRGGLMERVLLLLLLVVEEGVRWSDRGGGGGSGGGVAVEERHGFGLRVLEEVQEEGSVERTRGIGGVVTAGEPVVGHGRTI